jgi:hypothetical protein
VSTEIAHHEGYNPEWPADSVPLDLWDAVTLYASLSGPDVGRLRLALDTLAEADELLALARSGSLSDRDTIAAYAGVRAARKSASDLVAELTATPRRGAGRPSKPGATHGHRPQRSAA